MSQANTRPNEDKKLATSDAAEETRAALAEGLDVSNWNLGDDLEDANEEGQEPEAGEEGQEPDITYENELSELESKNYISPKTAVDILENITVDAETREKREGGDGEKRSKYRSEYIQSEEDRKEYSDYINRVTALCERTFLKKNEQGRLEYNPDPNKNKGVSGPEAQKVIDAFLRALHAVKSVKVTSSATPRSKDRTPPRAKEKQPTRSSEKGNGRPRNPGKDNNRPHGGQSFFNPLIIEFEGKKITPDEAARITDPTTLDRYKTALGQMVQGIGALVVDATNEIEDATNSATLEAILAPLLARGIIRGPFGDEKRIHYLPCKELDCSSKFARLATDKANEIKGKPMSPEEFAQLVRRSIKVYKKPFVAGVTVTIIEVTQRIPLLRRPALEVGQTFSLNDEITPPFLKRAAQDLMRRAQAKQPLAQNLGAQIKKAARQ